MKRALVERSPFDFLDEPFDELFIVVNERLEQHDVQVVTLQTTNGFTL